MHRSKGFRGSLLLFWISWAVQSVAFAQALPPTTTIDIDVRTVELEGDFTVDGAPPPVASTEIGTVSLVDPRGHAVQLGTTLDGGYGPTRIVEGVYTPRFGLVHSLGALPLNTDEAIDSTHVFTADALLDLDVPTNSTVFAWTLNGAPFPIGPGEIAHLLLRHRDSGNEFFLGTGSSSPIAARVIPGRYDLIYAYQSGDLIPENEHAIVASDLDLTTPGVITFDLESLVHFLEARLNGAPFVASQLETGRLVLVDPDSNDRVAYGPTHLGTDSRRILSGVYDIAYERIAGGIAVPANEHVIVEEDIRLTRPANPAQLSLSTTNIDAYSVSPTVTFDGSPPSPSPLETGEIVLEGPEGGEVSFGDTHAGLSTRMLVVGRYDVFYRSQAGWTAMPGNPNARIATALRVPANGSIAIDVPTAWVDFDFSMNGAPFSPSPLERGRFSLRGEEVGDAIDLGSTHVASGSRRIVAGIYDVVYDWQTGSVAVPRNEDFVVLDGAILAVDQTVAIDVATRSVQPAYALDGSAFPTAQAQHATFQLRDPHGGSLPLGANQAGKPASVIAIEGAYAAEYDWVSGNQLPRNSNAVVGIVAVPEPRYAAGLMTGLVLLAWWGRGSARRLSENRLRRAAVL